MRSPTRATASCGRKRCFAMPESVGFPQLANGSVVTVGTFDGVHLGHRDILRRVSERAGDSGLPGLLVTFRPHPLEVVNQSAAPMLLTPDAEQRDALADSGPLLVVVLPFTPALAAYSAEQFVTELLQRRYRMRELVIGYDHGLGRGRQGDATILIGDRRQARLRRGCRPADARCDRCADLIERDSNVDRPWGSRAGAARARTSIRLSRNGRARRSTRPLDRLSDDEHRGLGAAQTSAASRCIRSSRANGTRRIRRHDESGSTSHLRRSRRQRSRFICST